MLQSTDAPPLLMAHSSFSTQELLAAQGQVEKPHSKQETSEYIKPLDSPMLILHQTQNPRLFREIRGEDGLTYRELAVDYSPAVAAELDHIYYEPYLITPEHYFPEGMMQLLEKDVIEPSGYFGPYRLYRYKQPGKEGTDSLVAFGSQKYALQAIADVTGDTIPYQKAELTKLPEIPPYKNFAEEIREVLNGLPKAERTQMWRKLATQRKEAHQELETVLSQQLVQKLQDTDHIADFPDKMLQALDEIVAGFDQIQIPVNAQGQQDVLSREWLTWNFVRGYLIPLRGYLEHKTKYLQDQEGVTGLLTNFDMVSDIIHMQSHIALGEQNEPKHWGINIPIDQLQGSHAHGVELYFTDEQIIVNHKGEEYRYPMPEKNEDGELAFKGGIARLITKIALGIPVDKELPVADVDIVVFGAGFPAQYCKEKYGADVVDIERINEGVTRYLGDRDQALNEVVFTANGLIVSRNALTSYFNLSTQASAEPVVTLFGSHVTNVRRGNSEDGLGDSDGDFFLINGTRIPSARALSRMYKALIDGKIDTVTLPKACLKMDIGMQWLVMGRKIANIEDPLKQEQAKQRMLMIADMTKSPYFKTEYAESQSGFTDFLNAVEKKQIEKGILSSSGFDYGSKMDEHDTLVYYSRKLVDRLMDVFDASSGYPRERIAASRFTQEDILPIQIRIPADDQVQEQIEYENPGSVESPNSKRERMRRFFKRYSSELQPDDVHLIDAYHDYLTKTVPHSGVYRKLEVYSISEDKRDEFVHAMRQTGLASTKDKYQGNNTALTIIDLGMMYFFDHDSRVLSAHPDMDWDKAKQYLLFEEVFHMTGAHLVEGKQGAEIVRDFCESTKTKADEKKGFIFSEGLVYIAYSKWCQDNAKELTTGGFESESSVLGKTILEPIFKLFPDGGDALYQDLLLTRIGNKDAEQRAREAIDAVLDEGTFDSLMAIRSMEERSQRQIQAHVRRIRELSLRATLPVEVTEHAQVG